MNTGLTIKLFKERYFDFSILLFVASFLLLPTAKMVNNVYYLFLLLPGVVYLIYSRASALKVDRVLIVFSVFLFFNIVSGLATSASGQFYKHIFYVFVFFYVLVYLVDIKLLSKDLVKQVFFWAVTLYVFLSAVVYWSIGTYAVGERVLWLPSRMTGPIYTSILNSSVFLLVLPYFLNNKKYTQLVIGFLLSLFNIVFVVQSRSGLAALLAVGTLFALYRLIARKDYKVLAFPVFVILALLLIGMFAGSYSEIATKIVSRADAGRFALWQQLFYDFKACNLFVGCGPEVQSLSTFGNDRPILHPHSVFFSLIWYTGLLTFLAFMTLCVMAVTCGLRLQESWVLYLLSSMVGLVFDGSNVVGNPDEVWLLLLLPMLILLSKSRSKLNS